MKRLAQTLIIGSIFAAATAIAATTPPAVSSESQLSADMMQSIVSSDAGQRFSGIYQSVLPAAATERQLLQGMDSHQTAGTYCPTVGFSLALTEHSNEGHLGGIKC